MSEMELSHPCDLCERLFTTTSALKQHRSSIHKKGQGDFRCHLCDRRYTQVSNLCRHVRHDHKSSKRSAESQFIANNDPMPSTKTSAVVSQPWLHQSSPTSTKENQPWLTPITPTSTVAGPPWLHQSIRASAVVSQPWLHQSTPPSAVASQPWLHQSTPTSIVASPPWLHQSIPTSTVDSQPWTHPSSFSPCNVSGKQHFDLQNTTWSPPQQSNSPLPAIPCVPPVNSFLTVDMQFRMMYYASMLRLLASASSTATPSEPSTSSLTNSLAGNDDEIVTCLSDTGNEPIITAYVDELSPRTAYRCKDGTVAQTNGDVIDTCNPLDLRTVYRSDDVIGLNGVNTEVVSMGSEVNNGRSPRSSGSPKPSEFSPAMRLELSPMRMSRRSLRNVCVRCGAELAGSANLKRHMRVHTGERPFQCQRCGRAFSISSNLKRHVATVHKTCPSDHRVASDHV